MELIDKIKFSFKNLDILQKIILIMIIFFVIPYIVNTFLFLFNVNDFSVINLFDISPNLMDLIS